jgi:abortive infection bacteriophage resistance protein
VAQSLYPKPYLNYDEQVSLIAKRGVPVENTQEAIVRLKRLGYYRLSAYWYPFRKRGIHHREGFDTPDSQVVNGVVFSDIVAICDYDSVVRNVLLEAIEAVEVAVRAALAYEVGKFGALGYLDRQNLGPGCDHPSAIDPAMTDFEMFCYKQQEMVRTSKEDFARHFRHMYAGDCPIWAAIELWDFGTLSRYFQLMNKSDRDSVAHRFGLTSSSKLANWLECINDLRNFCAHHSRLNRRHFPKNPSFPRSRALSQFAHLAALEDKERHQLYPLLCVLTYLLDQFKPGHSWRSRTVGIIEKIDHLNGAKLADYGIPDQWRAEEPWLPIQ